MIAVPVLLGLSMLAHGLSMLAQAPPLENCGALAEGALDCWLSEGLARAIDAKSETDATRKKTLLTEAAFAFEQALILEPETGAALNNLAQVYADLGRDAEAERLFEKAVHLDILQLEAVSQRTPVLRSFYHRNYGDFLIRKGEWERAAVQYRQAVKEEPRDRQAHESLVNALVQHQPEALPEYLSFLIERGQVVWAEEVALDRLREAASEEYLTLLVAARAEQAPSPEQLLPEPVADVLRGLIGPSEVNESAREILLLGRGEDFDPASYAWWAERSQSLSGSGLRPRQAFRSLIRTFGEAQRQEERFDQARDYLRLGVLLSRDEPDLLAFRRMLDLPSAAKDVETIDRLAEWNEKLLRGSRVPQDDLYLYRHDLGLHYAFLGEWDRERSPLSAAYQLERATALTNTQSPPVVGRPGGDPPFDARIYARLMERYVDADRPAEAEQAWQELADAYRARGMEAEADLLLAVFKPKIRRPPERQRAVLDDPLGNLQDFTTEPLEPPDD